MRWSNITRGLCIATLLYLWGPGLVQAQDFHMVSGAPEGDVHYAINNAATIFASPDSSRPYIELGLREPVFITDGPGGWLRARTQDGATGYVRRSAVSNYWIRVSKENRALYLYRGAELQYRMVADFGYNVFADKEQRGSSLKRDHWRTPEGAFYVVNRNPNSMYYKAFVLNYPRPSDARRGLDAGLITPAQYDAIEYADQVSQMPPMNTLLGGWIEIHGDGTGSAVNWTRGCVAVTNDEMDELWRYVRVGTPVLVE